MHLPTPAITAAPLYLYDYTHGQRRLALWREPDLHARVAVYAALCVPVTLQAPGEPPETSWVEVATARAYEAVLVRQTSTHDTWSLGIGNTAFALYRIEVEAISRYLGIDFAALGEEGGA